MLLHTRTSVADIGYMVGYENPESFIRAFQKVYGCSPSVYRKNGNPS
ncbi:MAG: helix-turn-helix transcriptional regulator [Clostridia bacterium]|nr:helix-turn-helix transcriptional regulator [Clostridia bacterium]MBQ9251321.1 helix-turn-helix transcriptional regulator [Clostridia bacterium]